MSDINYIPQQEKLIIEPKHNEAIRDIRKRSYWLPTQKIFEEKLKYIMASKKIKQKEALVIILDYLTEILLNSKDEVLKIIKKRGKDIQQTSKSVAGNNYQALVAYALNRNIEAGNLSKNIVITLKPKKHHLVEKYATIKIGKEIQKPDMDLLIYQNKEKTPLIIVSCKTSLRERAGQTYRWKLLLELAIADPKHLKDNPDCPINKFNIKYHSDRKIYVGIIIADLYNEITQPQQQGMFAFFDLAYVSDKKKATLSNSVQPLSKMINELNNIYA